MDKSVMRMFSLMGFRERAGKVIPSPAYGYLRYWWRKVVHGGYYGLNGLDRKMQKYLNYSGGYFVELGANDGYTQSNTIFFERKKGWRGVLIEPAPHLFLKCCHFRGGLSSKIFCCACVPFGFTETYVDIKYANLMSRSINLTSDIDDEVAFHALASRLTSDEERSLSFGAPARTLTSVLDEAGAPKRIDFLSLDVEGAELDVLKGVDFSSFKFRYILVECRDIARLQDYMTSVGYELIDKLSKHDFLFSCPEWSEGR